MDWNWFFSALSQSTAAIVGLLGAFIFTKIVNNQQKFEENNRLINNFIKETDNLKEEFKIKFDYLMEHYNEFPCDKPVFFNVFLNTDRVDVRNLLSRYAYQEITEDYVRNIYLDREITLSRFLKVKERIRETEKWINLVNSSPESSELIDKIINYTKILFLSGVILPLAFLPLASINFAFPFMDIFIVLKIIFIMVVYIIFSEIFGHFKKKNNELKYDNNFIEKLRKITSIDFYHPQLKVFDQNKLLK